MDYVCCAGTACVACVGPDGARPTLGNGHLEEMKMMPLVDDDRKMEYDSLLIGDISVYDHIKFFFFFLLCDIRNVCTYIASA